MKTRCSLTVGLVTCLLIPALGADESAVRKWADPPAITTYWDGFLDGVKTKEDWRNRGKDIRRRFLELIRDSQKPEVKPPLDLKVHESRKIDDVYLRKLISYSVEKDERAMAYLAIPLGVDFPAPTVVALHGTSVYGKDISAGLIDKPRYAGMAHLNLLARRGYVVIAPDHFNMGQRTPPGGYVTAPFYGRHPDWTALGKIAYDASIAIDVLETLREVDTRRIGVTGISLGGQGTIMLAAYDSRIKAAACAVGAMPFQFNTDFRQFGIRKLYSYYPHLQPLFEKNELPPIDLHEIIALIAPRPFLDVSALEDKYGGSIESGRQRVLMHLAISRVYQLEGAPQNYAFYTHGQGHSFQHDVRELTYAWLDKHLKSASETTPRAVKDQ